MFEQRIAVIGGGVSGLSTAYEIGKEAIAKARKTKVVIYEKSEYGGGNAQTVTFSLGVKKNLPFLEPVGGGNLVRWADLGVNDINLTAYKALDKVMKDIGYNNDDDQEVEKRLLPLENTECYFTLDGHTAFTDDADMVQGVIDPNFSLQYKEEGNLLIFINLLYDAAFEAIKINDTKEDNLNITCADFFDNCVDNPKVCLEDFAKEKKYKDWYNEADWKNEEWLEKASEWVETLRDNIFYPRISAMYFANDGGPENMLLAAPFKYYKIQESGGEDPDRRYFVGGAQKWLEYLADFLTKKLDTPPPKEWIDWVDVEIVNEYDAQATIFEDRVEVKRTVDAKNFSTHYDYAVVTTHANDALKLLHFKNNDKQQEATITEILGSISYTTSIAVCHTWPGVLPPNRNLWRAYNVMIRRGAALKPYSMTYVCNRHQNDAKSNKYNMFGIPQFFVTLNPQSPIPDDMILRRLPHPEIPENLHTILPRATLTDAKLLQQKFNSKTNDGGCNTPDIDDRAITYFYHNLIDKRCFLAQRKLKKYYEANIYLKKPRIYFGGAWSNGSGLHEECWLQSESVAGYIFEDGQCSE